MGVSSCAFLWNRPHGSVLTCAKEFCSFFSDLVWWYNPARPYRGLQKIDTMWYDFFSLFYDRALEDLYAPFRPAAVDALRLSGGERVLDLPCGTGQSFKDLMAGVGPTGAVLGVDPSGGMLRRARKRISHAGWNNIQLWQVWAEEVDARLLTEALGQPVVDGILCALGLTALPDWETTFEALFSLIRPGGRFVLFDVYAAERTRETRSVELLARADLSRKAWLPLETRCHDFSRLVLPADVKSFGGELYVAAGTRPPPPDFPGMQGSVQGNPCDLNGPNPLSQ